MKNQHDDNVTRAVRMIENMLPKDDPFKASGSFGDRVKIQVVRGDAHQSQEQHDGIQS